MMQAIHCCELATATRVLKLLRLVSNRESQQAQTRRAIDKLPLRAKNSLTDFLVLPLWISRRPIYACSPGLFTA